MHLRFQVPFLGPESQLKSGFACAGLSVPNLYADRRTVPTFSKLFFVAGALCLSAGHHFETYSSTTSRSRPLTRGESIRG